NASYFDAIGMSFARGRAMTPALPEAVVNEAFARRFFAAQDAGAAIGQQLLIGERPLTIVGAVADANTRGPRSDTRNEMFLPYEFVREGVYSLVVRAQDGMNAASLIPAMRSLVASVDGRVPLAQPSTLVALHGDSLAPARLLAVLLAGFASAALMLALLGIY